MNCKPGDIAIAVKSANPRFLGKLFEVLYATPSGSFILPDGMRHSPARNPAASWVVRSLCGPLPAPCSSGPDRMAFYGSAPDSCLRPLRDDPDALEVESEGVCNS